MANDQELNETFDDIKDNERSEEETGTEKDAAYMALQDFHTDLGNQLDQEWKEAENEKIYTEKRNIRDLRQYRGQYDPEVLNKIHPNRSKAFIRLTRTKVKTFDARMMDVQFPANDDKNWGITPTPVPEINPQQLQEIGAQFFQQTGKVPTRAEVDDLVYKTADKASAAMQQEIADQLTEFDYRSTIREVLHSGHVYGTGILKGPMVKEITIKRWHKVGADWKQIKIKRIIPVAQSVSIWDIYPDMSAKCIEDARYLWQKHLFSKNAFAKLANRSDFNGKAIRAYMDVHPDGNAVYKHYEEAFREMSTNTDSDGDTSPPKREKYEVHERWGYITIDDAKLLLPDEPEDTWAQFDDPELACNIWMIDNMIIKAVLSPIEGSVIPYYFYYFDKDETSMFGDGVPTIMRDPQQLYNASIRAMLDNAAISAGPIIEANIDLLADGEDPLELFPFRVFQRIGSGIEANQQAIRVTKLPSYTSEFLGLVSFFQDTADESTTIPRSLHGSSDLGSGAASRTATGMSMLIGASNITLKDQVQFFDDGVTRPFIKTMYFWNMEFNPKESIKGDFNVQARGSKSLIAKEVKMEQINQFLSLTNNDTDLQYIKRDVLLRELAEIFDLDRLGFIRSEAEVAATQEQRSAAAKRAEDHGLLMEAFKAQSSGHAPDAVEKTIQMFGIQLPGAQPQGQGNITEGGPLG
jgi:sulfur transfer complex TusBCD TusB component (DsrH family)